MPLVAQLIGEEPWFDLCQQPLFQPAKTTLLLYYWKAISSTGFAQKISSSVCFAGARIVLNPQRLDRT
jgi:hypothetical protein